MYLLMIYAMRDDYRRMDIWFKTLLLFVVFNKVQLYRQLKNTTCLELAKPANQHIRLSCNDISTYHCLLNGDNTYEFEICKSWKWIPEGNCAYLNAYGWNIDARSCSSSAELACPETLYRSEDTIKYPACYVKKNTNSTARQVKNATCLELAKPSNKHLRLPCTNTGTYHCLLDQSYTKEYEICMMWKWISKGKCAYLNFYSGGFIDERSCISSSYYVCPEKHYRSENTTNYSACYIRNNPTMIRPLTSLPPAESDRTSLDGNGEKATSSRISETAKKHIEIKPHTLPTILGIIVPLLSIAVICFILFIQSGIPEKSQISSDRARNEDMKEQQPFLGFKTKNTQDSPPSMRHEDENITKARRNESQELSDNVMNEDTVEQQSLSGNEVEGTPESPPTIKHEEEIIGGARKNDDTREEWAEEKSSGSDYDPMKSDHEEDIEESVDVFDDTFTKSLQRVASTRDEQELCTELYNFLNTEGMKLTQNITAAIITRNTGKSVKTLSNSLTNEEKRKLMEVLPIEFNHILESKAEHGISFYVSYGLLRIYLDKKQSPKSGWGNPVKETDISIGDDIERLYMIHTIVRGIAKPDTVSVESYIRLLDIMIKALTRLDPDGEFKDNIKAFAKEITCFNTITQKQ